MVAVSLKKKEEKQTEKEKEKKKKNTVMPGNTAHQKRLEQLPLRRDDAVTMQSERAADTEAFQGTSLNPLSS